MKAIRLDQLSARERGEAQGETFAAEIRELAGIRMELLERRSPIEGRGPLMQLAQDHVSFLETASPELHDEFQGIVRASGVTGPELVVLNHYTDIRDIGNDPAGEEGGCSIVYSNGPDGPVLGQTWDMHGTAEPFVVVLDIVPPQGIPTVVFTVMGCLGMMGLNAEGVVVCINNLTPTDARIGILWPALVRQMLAKSTGKDALQVLLDAPLGSGHNYFIADEKQAWNVETTGGLKKITADNPKDSFWHTNHYLDPTMKDLEAPLYPTSTTLERYDRLCTLLRPGQSVGVQGIQDILGSHEGFPRSICSHLKGGGDPSASKTCGGVVCDVRGRTLYAAPGCLHEATYRSFVPGGAR